jgi:spore maturation protein CgeB
MRVLFGGPLVPWSTTEARLKAFQILGNEVFAVDAAAALARGPRFIRKLVRHLHVGPGVAAYNHELTRQAEVVRPDVVWLDLPIQVWPETIRALRSLGPLVISHNSEYVAFRAYWFRHLLAATDLYDVHVLTNELTAEMLRRRGARRIVMMSFAYDPALHRPLSLTETDQKLYSSDVVFVGHWEPNSERMVQALRRADIAVRVHGVNWYRALGLSDRARIRPVFGEEYVKVIAGAKLSLGLLSKWNHNQSAGRTFEIPAIGGFFLGDRTPAHQALFEEGVEAEFFSSPNELVDKCRHYLERGDERDAIAKAGHRRCLADQHTHVDELRRVLAAISA